MSKKTIVQLLTFTMLISWSYSAHSLIIKTYSLTDGAHTVFLFADQHDRFKELDVRQWQIFKNALVARDFQKNIPHLSVYVERPIKKSFFSDPCQVTTKIVDEYQTKYSSSLDVHNIENRCFATAACYMLHPKLNPKEMESGEIWDTGNASCTFRQVRFWDVRKEFFDVRDRILDAASCHVKNALEHPITAANKDFQDFSDALEEYHFDLDRKVLCISRFLMDAKEKRERLALTLLSSFAHLFDATILYKVLTSQSPYNAVFAGFNHVDRIKPILQSMNMHTAPSVVPENPYIIESYPRMAHLLLSPLIQKPNL